jgi:hypothetical protein
VHPVSGTSGLREQEIFRGRAAGLREHLDRLR